MKYRTLFFYLTGLVMLLPISLFASTAIDGGEVRFFGYVVDVSPKWRWQVASTNQHWIVDIADARRNGSYLFFDLRDKGPLPFLEGHLYKVAPRGGPGFSPQISFAGNGATLSLIDGDSLTDQKIRVSVPVIDLESGQEVGMLNFTLEQGIGISLGNQYEGGPVSSGIFLAGGESVTQARVERLSSGLMSRLSSLILMNQNLQGGMSAASNGKVLHQSVLSAANVMNIAAAYASSLSEFELQLPALGTPYHWQARLAVTVTVP